MDKKLKILHLEDYASDAMLVGRALQKGNFDFEKLVVDSKSKFIAALKDFSPDIILSDHSLPSFNSYEALTILQETGMKIPFILITANISEEFAVDVIKRGADDYILKDRLQRLPSAIHNALEKFRLEKERQHFLDDLIASEKRYSNLFHLSPQPMWLYDPETLRFMQMNKATLELYGYTEDEFLNMKITDLLAEKKENTKNGTSIEGAILKGTFRHLKKSREAIYIEIYSTPITLYDKLFITVIAIDVTEKILYEYKLTRAIIKTQEDERYEIGSELHDNVCQILATSQLSLGMLKETLNPSVELWYNQCDKSLMLASNEIRNLSHRLAPAFFDNASMEDTFRLLFNDFNAEKKYTVSIDFDKKLKKYVMNRDIQLNVYRIMQEQLRNIQKYALATHIQFTMLIENDKLKMQLIDDGIGFDVSAVKSGIGLANMKRRAELFQGKFEIDSSPGNGCAIHVEIPMKEPNVVTANLKPTKTIRKTKKKPDL